MRKILVILTIVLIALSIIGCNTIELLKESYNSARAGQFIEDNKDVIDKAKQELDNTLAEVDSILTEEQKKKLTDLALEYTKEIKEIITADKDYSSSKYETAKVVRVKDGDTLVAEINGKEETIRLIGVDTPESVGKYKDNPEPYGVEASKFTKSILTPNKTIYLTKDVGNKDNYQRLLRYVWIEKPDNEKLKESMVNAILVNEGYANVMTVPPNVKYAAVFKTLEKEARELNKGLWDLK
jgi:endonuclease YncB( thermonuclease family)